MRIWLALIVSPSIALACQSILYAMATPSCATQSRLELHAVAVASLVLTLAFTLLAHAGSPWHHAGSPGADDDHADPGTTRAFLARAAAAVSALSAFTVLAMWMVVWVLSPCAQ